MKRLLAGLAAGLMLVVGLIVLQPGRSTAGTPTTAEQLDLAKVKQRITPFEQWQPGVQNVRWIHCGTGMMVLNVSVTGGPEVDKAFAVQAGNRDVIFIFTNRGVVPENAEGVVMCYPSWNTVLNS